MSKKPLSKQTEARLAKLRKQIDKVDRKMMEALAKRFRIVDEIGKLKRANNLPVIQKSRMNAMLKGRKDDSLQLKLDPKLIYEIFDLLHDASIDAQVKIVHGVSKRKSKR